MTTAETIYDDTLKNGGGTFSLNGRPVPTTGYMVSRANSEWVIPIDRFSPEVVTDYLLSHPQVKRNLYHLGTWIHEDNVYLDTSVNIQTLALARFAGQVWGQIAIWDLENNSEIALDKATD